jgi:alpha-ribazole phosphatase
MEIHLIRHTAPEIESGYCYGQSDIDVKKTFKEEADKTLKEIPNLNLKVYSSPLKRCSLLAQEISTQINFDDRLKELNFGDWEMKKWEEIPKVQLDNWMNNYLTARPNNGETFIEMEIRLRSFLQEIFLQNKDILLVTHAGVIRMINGILKDSSKKDWMSLKINYGGIISIIIN